MAKAKKSNDSLKLSLETRIMTSFALLEFCRIDADNLTDDDISLLFQRTQEIVDAANRDDDKALDTAVEYDLESISSRELLKERIQRSRIVNAYKAMGYVGLCDGPTHNHIPNAQETMATLLHNLKFNDADELAAKIFNKTLDEHDANHLFDGINKRKSFLIDNLRSDWKTYNTKGEKNPVIDAIRSDLDEYTFSTKKRQEDIPFFTPNQYRKKYGENKEFKARQNFSKTNRDHFTYKVKPKFLKFIGNLAEAGKNSIDDMDIKKNYNAFSRQVEEWYGEKAIDEVLGISTVGLTDKEVEVQRQSAFKKKSEETYCKMVTGIISEKLNDKDRGTEWNLYLNNINKHYIPSLLEGFNNLGALAFWDYCSEPPKSLADEQKLAKKLREDAAEDQRISIHHNKVTVASSYDVSKRFYSNLDDETRLEKSKNLVSNPGGLVFVIGRNKHQSMEPNGFISFGEISDHSIFAARVNDCAEVNRIVSKFPAKLQKKITEYVKLPNNGSQDISVQLSLLEAKEISNLRDALKSPKKENISILNKEKRLFDR